MNVSFGKFTEFYDKDPNRIENKVLYKIGERLNPDHVELVQRKHNYKGGNLADLLADKKDADIEVTLKQDGMIDVCVVRNSGMEDYDGNSLCHFIPYSVIGSGKLKMTIDPLLAKSTINKKLNNFANQCYWYATEAESRRNRMEEDKFMETIETICQSE